MFSVALAPEYEDVLKRKGLLPISEAEADERILEVAIESCAAIDTFNKRDFDMLQHGNVCHNE